MWDDDHASEAKTVVQNVTHSSVDQEKKLFSIKENCKASTDKILLKNMLTWQLLKQPESSVSTNKTASMSSACVSAWHVALVYLPRLLSSWTYVDIYTNSPTHPFTHSPASWRHLSSTQLRTSAPFGSACWLGQVVDKTHSRGPRRATHTQVSFISLSPAFSFASSQ